MPRFERFVLITDQEHLTVREDLPDYFIFNPDAAKVGLRSKPRYYVMEKANLEEMKIDPQGNQKLTVTAEVLQTAMGFEQIKDKGNPPQDPPQTVIKVRISEAVAA